MEGGTSACATIVCLTLLVLCKRLNCTSDVRSKITCTCDNLLLSRCNGAAPYNAELAMDVDSIRGL